jgi:hypothetical protein
MVLLLITLIVIGVLFWAAKRILAVLPLDDPMKTIIYVVLVVMAVFWCIQIIFGFIPGWPVANANWRMH